MNLTKSGVANAVGKNAKNVNIFNFFLVFYVELNEYKSAQCGNFEPFYWGLVLQCHFVDQHVAHVSHTCYKTPRHTTRPGFGSPVRT